MLQKSVNSSRYVIKTNQSLFNVLVSFIYAKLEQTFDPRNCSENPCRSIHNHGFDLAVERQYNVSNESVV